MHSRALSWNHQPVVPDQTLFSLSKSNFLDTTASQNTILKPAGRPSGNLMQGGPTALFSNLFSPKETPLSMKLRPPKKSPRYNHDTSILEIKSLSPTLYDDPAFSPDPLVHPFFATSHGAWTSPPMAGHPTLRKDAQRPPHLAIPYTTRDSGEFYLIQPPNSPVSDDDPGTNASPHSSVPSPHLHTPAYSATMPTDAAPTATTTHSRSAPLPVQSYSVPQSSIASGSDGQSREPTDKAEKKRKPLAMFWRKSPSVSPISEHANHEQKRNELPPSYETIFTDPPSSLPVVVSAKTEAHKTSSITSLSAKSAKSTTGSRASSATRRPAVAEHSNHRNKLDRIDELDETNPLGIPVHHGGPYEAIQRLVRPNSRRNVPYNVESQYSVSVLIPLLFPTLVNLLGASFLLVPPKVNLTR